MHHHFRLKLLATAMGMGIASVAMATPVVATTNTVAIAQATQIKPSAHILGVLPGSHPIHIEVALKLRHQTRLHTFIKNVHSGSALITKRALTPEEFRAAYSPTLSQAREVAAYLRRHGFTHIHISSNRTLVSADGTMASAQTAFSTNFAKVQTASGHVGYMNTSAVHIPARFKDSVLSVIGLQNVHHAHTIAQPASGSASPQALTGHNPVDWPAIYGGTALQTAAGVPVGIITAGPQSQTITDLNTFTSNNNLPQVQTQVVHTNGHGIATGLPEWDLDSQDIVGMAGGEVGKIIFYTSPSLRNDDLVANLNTVVTNNDVKIINVSLGECETAARGDGSAAAADQIFEQAVAQGQTFSIATGDKGADECGNGGTVPSWPANSQYVVAVAGTSVSTSGTSWLSESVWNNSHGATGGSESTYEPQPSWQQGLFPGNHRGVADVAYAGDPVSGAKIIVNGGYHQYGGTSLSAPLFAGFWARVIATKGSDVGFAAPLLYQLPAEDFHDITVGNNNGEQASPGYDLASGLGTIIMGKAMADIGGSTPPPNNNPPEADFTDSVNGLDVSFTNTSSDSDGSIVSRSWDFDDGSTSSKINPDHAYANAGTYTVTLTVTDNDGASDSSSKKVTVPTTSPGNNPPTASFTDSVNGLSVSFTNTSSDSDGSIASRSWDFGDGSTSNQVNPSHTYAGPGTYTVKLTVTDNDGASDSSSKQVIVSSQGGNGVFNNPTDTPIPNIGSVISRIDVTGEPGAAPSNLQVHADIVTPNRGGLVIWLIAPDGRAVLLKRFDYFDKNRNFSHTWTINASMDQGNGTWKLRVIDMSRGNSGYLDDWSLKF